MLRTISRWFSTDETKRLAQDVDRWISKLQDLGIQGESLQLRVDRHLNKLQMRDARAKRSDRGLTDEEEAMLEDLRQQRGNGGDWPPM